MADRREHTRSLCDRAAFSVLSALFLVSVPTAPTLGQAEVERTAVLAINSEFYRAFRESDMAAMGEVWASQEPVAVQHPASRRIDGRRAVLQSWAWVLAAPPAISCSVESVFFEGGRWSVICLEHLNPGTVRMINIFDREKDGWNMIYHGPAPTDARVS